MSEQNGVQGVFDREEVREVLRESFYKPDDERPRVRSRRRRGPRRRPNEQSYEVICISLYNEDLARLDEKVGHLKASGHRKMSRSALIRYALDTCDLDALPKSY